MAYRCPVFTLLFCVGVISSGCSTTGGVDSASALRATTALLSIDSTSVIYQHAAEFGVTSPGGTDAVSHYGLYTQTDSEVVLFSFSTKTKTFSKFLSVPLAQVRQATVVRWGMFKQLAQLQIAAGEQVLVVHLLSKGTEAAVGDLSETLLALAALRRERCPGAVIGPTN